jgi:hypothetical protein
VRLWRALKDLGAASLRDGVTLVPAAPAMSERLAEIVSDIETAGGTAWVFTLPRQAPSTEERLRGLFDRTEAYASAVPPITELRQRLATLDEADVRRKFRRMENEFQSIARLDFFPGAMHARVRKSLDKLAASIDRHFSPDEPSSSPGRVPKRRRRDFEGARWATRKQLWVDRAASAWLIKRFIDPRAQFIWLAKPADCPADAHGFDFDGATFTHVHDLVTFEVLVEAFDLKDDAGLVRLGRLVRYLDGGGGEGVAEAAGFEAVLAGLRESSATDDALLDAVTPVLDALHQHFSQPPH